MVVKAQRGSLSLLSLLEVSGTYLICCFAVAPPNIYRSLGAPHWLTLVAIALVMIVQRITEDHEDWRGEIRNVGSDILWSITVRVREKYIIHMYGAPQKCK